MKPAPGGALGYDVTTSTMHAYYNTARTDVPMYNVGVMF